MAILTTLPGVEVTIESQGKTSKEYNDDTQLVQWNDRDNYHVKPDRWVSKYVECESDVEFRVMFSIRPPYQMESESLTFVLMIDGQKLGGTTMRKKDGSRQTLCYSEVHDRVNEHEIVIRKLKFASVQKIDEGDSVRIESDSKVASILGEISIRIYRSETIALPTPRLSKSTVAALNNAPAEISEKALKGKTLSHGLSFGEQRREQRLQKPRKTETKYLDGNRNPIGILVLKYRSREALKQEHIIPRTPSPSPEISMVPLNSRNGNGSQLSQQQGERLAELQREIDTLKSGIKVKEESNSTRRKRSGENLQPAREYKTIRRGNGSVIYDLTEED